MKSHADPYHKLLGISDAESPPNHYRLLGIDLFESDLEVIQAAAERQMLYLHQIKEGKDLSDAQRILNEIAQAKICLLNSEKKQLYDAQLKLQIPNSTTTFTRTQKRKFPSAVVLGLNFFVFLLLGYWLGNLRIPTPPVVITNEQENLTQRANTKLAEHSGHPQETQPIFEQEKLENGLELHRLRFESEEVLKHFVITQGGGRRKIFSDELQITATRKEPPIRGGDITYKHSFNKYSSINIRGRIVPPSDRNFRIEVGSLLVLFNWEVADQNHFQYKET